MPERHDIWQIADAIQMDLRAAQAKMIELRAQLSALNLPDANRVTCPNCGVPMKGPRTLAEHLYHSHNGPVPEHWEAIDAMSLEPGEADREVARAQIGGEAA